MCGIFGYIGQRQAVPIVLDGLKKLEYRGYDSSGIAWICDKKILVMKHLAGPSLLMLPKTDTSTCKVCIGHTRWATHGKVTLENTHPIFDHTGKFAIVHNGIIDNHHEITTFLKEELYIEFQGDTDTECIINLISYYYENFNLGFVQSVIKAAKNLKGNYAFVVMHKENPELLLAFRRGTVPLVIGKTEDKEYFVSSDVAALVSYTNNLYYIDEDKVCKISSDSITLPSYTYLNDTKHKTSVNFKKIDTRICKITKENYKYFMLKEIMEQPKCFTNVDFTHSSISLLGQDYSQISLIGCGTSYHAALIGAKLINQFVEPVCAHAEYASEYIDINNGSSTNLLIALSQSGETADVINAIKISKSTVVGITNTKYSALNILADHIILTQVNPEIGVASTKTFIGQLTALLRLCGITNHKLNNIAKFMKLILDQSDNILSIVIKYIDRSNWLYLGRGYNYPIALEGALKLKEVSYIHAEGMPAAEMKHGPIALIDDGMPCVFIAPQGKEYSRIVNNIEEVRSRGGRIITIATEKDTNIKNISDDVIYIPKCEEHLQPLLTVIPLQLIAYHAGVLLGRDVDKPRNLAKSVTV